MKVKELKGIYERPEMEVKEFAAEDIIVTSLGDEQIDPETGGGRLF